MHPARLFAEPVIIDVPEDRARIECDKLDAVTVEIQNKRRTVLFAIIHLFGAILGLFAGFRRLFSLAGRWIRFELLGDPWSYTTSKRASTVEFRSRVLCARGIRVGIAKDQPWGNIQCIVL